MTPQNLWLEAMSVGDDPAQCLEREIDFLEDRIKIAMQSKDNLLFWVCSALEDMKAISEIRKYLLENIEWIR